MDIVISNTSGEPIYQQIVDQVKDLIVSEQMEEEEMLPSIRQLAKDLRISVITTKRAYEELEREGFIRSIPGKGSFVAPYNREQIMETRLKQIESKLADIIKESMLLGLSQDDLIGILVNLYEK